MQWWERSPTGPHTSHVGIVNCWFSPLLWRFFSEYSGFPHSTTTNSQFRIENSKKKKKKKKEQLSGMSIAKFPFYILALTGKRI